MLTATELRKNIYKLLDEALETGEPIEIKRKGQTLRIIPEKPKSKLENLPKRDTIIGDPEDLVSIDWSKEWKPYI